MTTPALIEQDDELEPVTAQVDADPDDDQGDEADAPENPMDAFFGDDDDADPLDEDTPEGEADTEPVTAEADAPAVEATPEPDEIYDVTFDAAELGLAKGYTIPHVQYNNKTKTLSFTDPRGASRVHTLIKHGVLYEQKYRPEMDAMRKRLETDVPAAQQDAKQFLDTLIQQAKLPEDQYIQAMLDFRANVPDLVHQMELEALRRENATLKGGSEATAAPPEWGVEEVIQEWADTNVSAMLDRASKSGQAPWLTPPVVQRMTQALARPEYRQLYLVRATADHVRENPALTLGEPTIDYRRLTAICEDLDHGYREAHTRTQAERERSAKQLQTLGQKAQRNAPVIAAAQKAQQAHRAPKPATTPATPLTDEQRKARLQAEIDSGLQSLLSRDRAGRFVRPR